MNLCGSTLNSFILALVYEKKMSDLLINQKVETFEKDTGHIKRNLKKKVYLDSYRADIRNQ